MGSEPGALSWELIPGRHSGHRNSDPDVGRSLLKGSNLMVVYRAIGSLGLVRICYHVVEMFQAALV